MSKRAFLLVVMAAGLGALTSCSSPVPTRTELVKALETSGIPAAQAMCSADAIVKNLSHDQVALIVERGGGGAPPDDPKRTDDTSDKVRAALAACRDAGNAPS